MLAAASYGDGFHQQVDLAPVMVIGWCSEPNGEKSAALFMKADLFMMEDEPSSQWLNLLKDIKDRHFPNNCL